MTSEPPSNLPPSGPPLGWEVPPPGSVTPPASPAPPGYPASAYPPIQPSSKTEPFAIVSLAVSLGGIVTCLFPVTGIVAVIFGHLGLGRTKRSGTKGRGMALAGTIIGYVEIVLTVVFVAGIVVFTAIAVDSTNDARRDAREFGREIQNVAVAEGIPTRSAEAVRQAIRQSDLDPDDVTLATSGARAVDASSRQLEAEAWELEVSTSLLGSACLIVPSTASVTPVVRDFC